jgi:HrpA-like RNA helicase
VHNFPFPTPPEEHLLSAAHRCLVALGALDPSTGQLTELGSAMAAFPISPRHARMLLEVALQQHRQQQRQQQLQGAEGRRRAKLQDEALPYAVALAAALSVESPFVHVESVGSEKKAAGGWRVCQLRWARVDLVMHARSRARSRLGPSWAGAGPPLRCWGGRRSRP